ncbi:lysylphosphatidylglycerol synthase-like protein [Pontibacter ummariensis]|uniref:Lysylphosphatidylglycerol synthase TM region n=1 Tax=Pontibacter ummariensis TaxID=1610492 RepID=A0A239KP58_9BACT|nr:lysylphosphatidylglycerol synthase domain-containing protein [Pontibacter ummariensis]PRY05361.1 lysylphosphatidylglycerol synthase-like protein [Pontibacter ummariensis]SNT19855.1 Lysylphosphatidylglycerol synthase TM region [Pontibacter ummariensis]
MSVGKGLVVLLTLYLLYQTVFTAPDAFLDWGSILRAGVQSPLNYLLLVVALLIPLNWGVEARKWQLLGQKVEPLSFGRAYRAVMVGLTLGFITPNRLGDYAGRVLELKSHQRLQSIGAVFIGRFCQLVATLLMGTLGLLYFVFKFLFSQYPAVSLSLMVMLVALCAVAVVLLYNAKALVAVVEAIKPLKSFVRYIAIIGSYTSSEITKLLWLSLGRYLVFLLQFVLLLVLFRVELTWMEYLSGVSGTFFLKSVVPSVSLLSDLGVRELSAMYLFGLLGQARLQVLSASLSLWVLNIAMPSLVGVGFVLRLRLAKRKEVTA